MQACSCHSFPSLINGKFIRPDVQVKSLGVTLGSSLAEWKFPISDPSANPVIFSFSILDSDHFLQASLYPGLTHYLLLQIWWSPLNCCLASTLAPQQSICNTSVRVTLFSSAQTHLWILYTNTHDGQQSNTYLAPTSSPASCPSITPIDEFIAVAEAILCFQTDWAHSQPPVVFTLVFSAPRTLDWLPAFSQASPAESPYPRGLLWSSVRSSDTSTPTPSAPCALFSAFSLASITI